MPTPLGTFTANEIIDRVLNKAGITIPTQLERKQLLNQLRSIISDIADKITKADTKSNKYTVPLAIVFTNDSFNIASTIADYKTMVYLKDDTYGKVDEVDNERFENLAFSKFWDNALFCTLNNLTLRLFKGKDYTATTHFTLYYVRYPITLVTYTDRVDLPDEYRNELENTLLMNKLGNKDATPVTK